MDAQNFVSWLKGYVEDKEYLGEYHLGKVKAELIKIQPSGGWMWPNTTTTIPFNNAGTINADKITIT